MRTFVIASLLVVCGLVLLAPWASEHPDGLEHVLGEHAGAEAAVEEAPPAWVLFPDYGWRTGSGGTIGTGLIGAGVVLAAGWTLGRVRLVRTARKP